MEKWFTITWTAGIGIFISSVIIYLAVIFFTRMFGKRSFSKMSSFDFAMTVAIGSLIGSTILSESVSLAEGILGLFLVYLLQLSAAFLRRFTFFAKAIDNTPLLLMDGPKILHENLKKARVTEGDLRAKLREANVVQRSHIMAVVFETTGDISVIHSQEKSPILEGWLLKDVIR